MWTRRPASRPRTLVVLVVLIASTLLGCGHSPAGYDASWHQVAEASFPGGQLDGSRWSVYDGASPNPTENRRSALVTVTGGHLQMTTQGQSGSGLCWCWNQPLTRYGRWEVRERMSAAPGHGQATLLWPADNRWPIHGEIDFSEINDPQRVTSTATVHYSAANRQVAASTSGDFTRWHVFAVEREPNAVRVWRDGVPVFLTTDTAVIPHTPMYLAIQAGPNQAGAPAVASSLQVAWVKVFAP